jgi:succinyl-diaminopimelate desuccinylase
VTGSVPLDPLPLAQALIRCPSVTPDDAGAQAVLAESLEAAGFTVTRLRFGAIDNLIARRGNARRGDGTPHFGFAGHTDVVPPGSGWRHDPFAGTVVDGALHGRGAADMKGAIAAFIAAAASRPVGTGTITLIITGDEEGEAINGTVKLLDYLDERQEIPNFCLVGEPTSMAVLGDVVKIGRRGSVSARITVRGRQGHVAYPHLADNPIHRLTAALHEMSTQPLDQGTAWFEPSGLQITSIDVGNQAGNVIPAEAKARLNIRFNDHHTGGSLSEWIDAVLRRHAPDCDCVTTISGESFHTEAGPATTLITRAIETVTGVAPRLDTGGGTSDARFIARFCPVAEFGLVGASMHRADECVPVAELRDLALIYQEILEQAGL